MARYFTSIFNAEKIPALATALGDMILAWTQVEDAQVNAMASMLDININDCLRLYQKLPNFRSRTQMLYLLMELNPEFEPIRDAVAGISKLSKTRNRYVHGGFIRCITDHEEIRSIDYAQPSNSKERSKPVKPADVTNHANAVRRRANELETALHIVPAYKAWTKTPRGARMTAQDLRKTQQ